MRDFPVFTTENGVASLIFRDVPYRGVAYIRIQSTQSPEALLKDCLDFSLAVGAERVYATGHPVLESYPLYTAIYQMQFSQAQLPDCQASVFPVTEQTLERFRELYNARMEKVPCSAYMTRSSAEEMLNKAEGYFVHDQGALLGIGMISGGEIKALAACKPGAGQTVLTALCHAVCQAVITLECASENRKAMDLYEEFGFLPTREISRWYCLK